MRGDIDWDKILTDETNTETVIETMSSKEELEDLPINEEYRLVETKAVDNRLIPEEQWKIEFMHGEYDESDESIITVNDTKLKITAIGNPAALAITEDGKLQLPNREGFDFPTSGSLGSKTIYQIGIVIIAVGGVLLISRKAILLNKKGKKAKKYKAKRSKK